MPSGQPIDGKTTAIFEDFKKEFEPLQNELPILTDKCTGAKYCECHIKAKKIVTLGTTGAPLDTEHPEYKANREVALNDAAFLRMKLDAQKGRSFSNIVAEYRKDLDPDHPLKIIGGQHRFEAIQSALAGQNEYHGIKVYFDLDMDQRTDVQLISNTNIAISKDLIDRIQETAKGGALREWCQSVGLLKPSQQFTDKYKRGGPISVQIARTFITNYYKGNAVSPNKFEVTDTTADKCPAGKLLDPSWEQLEKEHPTLWKDEALAGAAREFVALAKSQRDAFAKKQPKPKPDYPEKAMNLAVLGAWAYVAGVLQHNGVRLTRHYALSKTTGHDPLNAEALAHGKHKTDDPDNYRGLGYRTDPKERGRLVELFYFQSENGHKINKHAVDVAIANYFSKRARLAAAKVLSEGQ